MMHSIRPLFVAILALALGAYAFDCEAVTTPEQAMQCKSMHCSPHGHHGQDCCKAMPTKHAPFVRPFICAWRIVLARRIRSDGSILGIP